MKKDYTKIIYEKTNNKIKLISFIDYESKINKFKCMRCGNEFLGSIHSALRKENFNRWCPYCQVTSKTPTKEQAIYKLNLIDDYKKDYSLVEYGNSFKNKSVFMHKACKKTFNMAITQFIYAGHRCPYCQHRSFKYSEDEIDNKIYNIDPTYRRISNYYNNDKKIKFHHDRCNKEFDMTFHNFQSGARCPYCWKEINSSKGEKAIEKILNQFEVIFSTQYSFKNCKNIRILKFDFYIEKLNLLIEFDGKQHFHEYEFYGGLDKLKRQRMNDDIKTNYCKENNYNLLRISYKMTKKEIYNLLDELINKNQISSTTNDKYYYSLLDNYEEYYEKTQC